MELKDFLNIDAHNIVERQEIAISQYVSNKLIDISELIIAGAYDKVEEMLGYSPSGDECGAENSYINFCEIELDKRNGTDIGTVINRLKLLKRMKERK